MEKTATKFQSSTPAGISECGVEAAVQYARTGTHSVKLPSVRVRLNLVRMLYDVLGFDLTPDVALAGISEPLSTLVLATAGSGKTTWAQIKAVLQKIIRPSVYHSGHKISGDAILCLVYNKNNVVDMKNKHKQIVSHLLSANINGLDIDNEINAYTMHSFCDFWRREYVGKMGLIGFKLLDDAQSEAFMRRAVRIAYKKLGSAEAADKIDARKVLELYTLKAEGMFSSVQQLRETDKFVDLKIPADELEAIFERYDAAKKLQRRYDFVDMLARFYWLLQNDQQAKERVQKYYEYVIVDEVQDLTPLMWNILRLMVDDGTPLTCIGDEDQCIYGFRGADIYNVLQFRSMFQDADVYSLFYNRRCGKRILDEARSVIEMNELRFNKSILGSRDGGSVAYYPYNSDKGQIINVVRSIKQMSGKEMRETVVCYRESACSTLLVDMLVEEDLPFNVLSGDHAFSYELYRHLFSVLDALEMPYDAKIYSALYKVLPCTREAFFNAIGYDPITRQMKNKNAARVHFSQVDYGPLKKVRNFSECLRYLAELSDVIEKWTLSELVPVVFKMMGCYFWKYKKSISSRPDLDDLMEHRVLKYFTVDMTYAAFYQQHQRKLSLYRHYCSDNDGVTISTFHSLKGLEFKNVIVICMNNEVFPNYPLIESKKYSPDIIKQLKEGETRLWYVVVTRAVKNLTVYYDRENPSIYVQYALSGSFPCVWKEPVYEDLEDEFADGAEDSLDAGAAEAGVGTGIEEAADALDSGFEVKAESVLGASVESMFKSAAGSDRLMDEDADLNTVTLHSGKSLYLSRLLENLA